ncbi:ATP-dependent DNA helicase Q4, partial [Durusdinium trenchii]
VSDPESQHSASDETLNGLIDAYFAATSEPSSVVAGGGLEMRKRLEAALGAQYTVSTQARPLHQSPPAAATGSGKPKAAPPAAGLVRLTVARLLMDPAWPDLACDEMEAIVHAVAQFLAGVGSVVLPAKKWSQHQFWGRFRNLGAEAQAAQDGIEKQKLKHKRSVNHSRLPRSTEESTECDWSQRLLRRPVLPKAYGDGWKDLREMCSDILDRAKIDTVIRTLRGLIEEHQQDGFYNVLEEVLSDHRGLKISELLKQNQEDAEKISKLGLELLKAKQDLATALREEKQASEALTQTTKMWQNADSMSKDLEQSLEDANNELADVKEQVDALRKEPGFLREKMTQMKEEHEKELESLQQQLEQAQKELQEEKEKESDNPMVAALGKKGSQKFENLADAIASTQQSFGPQEQFLIALNLLKSVPNSQITKPGDVLKAIVEEARPALMKELLNMDHMALGTSKHRLAMAQKLITNIPEEDSALVADIVPEHIGKEMAVKVLGASATEEASGEVHGQAVPRRSLGSNGEDGASMAGWSSSSLDRQKGEVVLDAEVLPCGSAAPRGSSGRSG